VQLVGPNRDRDLLPLAGKVARIDARHDVGGVEHAFVMLEGGHHVGVRPELFEPVR
jgi:hypothetical protein